jgi:pimeloyl-ACP methyl ester carboxylesterase
VRKRPKVSSQATCLDFVEVAIHSYRHRWAAQSDPAFEPIEAELAKQPVITVPTIVLHGESDGVSPPHSSERHDRFFIGLYQRRVVPIAGHFLPRETPEAVVQAVRELGS